MGRYQGMLRLAHSADSPVRVELDLEDELVTIRAGSALIGEWPISELGIRGQDDGFHMRAGGDEMIVDLTEDVAFALEIGLQSASPRLRRRMGAAFNEHR